MTEKSRIETTNAPAAAFAFSQGIRKGAVLQVSGQGSIDAATGEYLYANDVAAQTTLVLENIRAIVEAGDASFDDIVMLRVYLTTRDHFAAMNEAYAAFVTANTPSGVLPSRTTVFTGLPHEKMLVEIDGLAIVDPA
jgi:reactive intermediate/imine deaminase